MVHNLKEIATWIPIEPCNFFKVGLLLDIPYSTLVMVNEKHFLFFEKCYQVLILAYDFLGDEFPSKLKSAFQHLDCAGSYLRQLEKFRWQDPFLHYPASFQGSSQPSFEHSLHSVLVDIACHISYEPGIDVLATHTFGLMHHHYLLEENMALRLIDIFMAGYSNLDVEVFFSLLKQFVKDLMHVQTIKWLFSRYDNLPEALQNVVS